MPIAAVFDAGPGTERLGGRSSDRDLERGARRIAGYDAEWAFIGAGVPEGAKVVALGVHKLDAGEKVHVVDSLAGL